MQIFVKSLLGRTLTLDVEPSDSVKHVKEQIQGREPVAAELRLLLGGKQLEDAELLLAYNIQKLATLHVVASLPGGAKKRKKKVYTKPKKIKHKKKKIRLAVLKYYKVDDNGKVTRLRRECPNAECGAGVFMANHFDRQYCGKCGLTYTFNKDKKEDK